MEDRSIVPTATKEDLYARARPYDPDSYLKELDKGMQEYIAKDRDPLLWKDLVTQLVKRVWADVLQNYGMLSDPVPHAFCLCGSLVKGQATAFSDLDCFIITQDNQTTDRLRENAIPDLENIFQYIFDHRNQLMFDPIGINAARFNGTPQDLVNAISSGSVPDPLSYFNSMMTSAPIFGIELFGEFRERLNNIASKRLKVNPREPLALIKIYYDHVINQYPGPQNGETINFKSHIFRPLDFLMMALRFENNIPDDQQGRHLNTKWLSEQLLARGKIAPEVHQIICDTFDVVMKLRSMSHLDAKEEQDTYRFTKEPVNVVDESTDQNAEVNAEAQNKTKNKKELEEQLRILIDQIALLRGIAIKRLALIRSGTELSNLPVFGIDDFFNPEYKDNFHTQSDMQVDLSALAKEVGDFYIARRENDKARKYYRIAETLSEKKKLFELLTRLHDKRNVDDGLQPAIKEQILLLITQIRDLEIKSADIALFYELIEKLTELNNNPTSIKEIVQFEQAYKNLPESYQPIIQCCSVIANNVAKMLSSNAIVNLDDFELAARISITPSFALFRNKNPIFGAVICLNLAREERKLLARGSMQLLILDQDSLNTVNMIAGIEIVSTYPSKKFFHTKGVLVDDMVKTAYEKLAISKECAFEYLYSQYRQQLKADPDSTLTKLLAKGILKSLKKECHPDASIYDMHLQIMRFVSPHDALSQRIAEYNNKRVGSLDYIFTFRTNSLAERQKTTNILTRLAEIIRVGKDYDKIDFTAVPDGFWGFVQDKKIVKIELRAVLLRQLHQELENVQLNYDNNHGTQYHNMIVAKGAIQSLITPLLETRDSDISNKNLAKLVKALRLASAIVISPDPAANVGDVAELNALIKKMKKEDSLKPFIKHFRIFTDNQRQKAKLVDKITKKRNAWKFGFQPKREALDTLITDINDATDRTVPEVIQDWRRAHNEVIQKPRFFKTKETDTDKFVKSMEEKYKKVQLKRNV